MMPRLGKATRPKDVVGPERASYVLASAAILVSLLAGCAPWSKSATPSASSSGPATSSVSSWFGKGSGSGVPLTLAPGSPPRDAFGNPEEPGAMEKISTGFSNAGKKVKNVFHPVSQRSDKDKVVAPDDPVSLNSKPTHPSADFYVSVARMEERSNNLKSATAQCQRALEIDPKHLGALLALARLYDRQGELKDATKYYRLTTKYHPNEPSAFNDLGLCLARQKQYEESAESLRKAVELQPDKVLYRNNLATVLVELDRIDEAFETLSAVHGKTVSRYNIGFLLNRRGKKPQALEQFRLAAASDRNFEAAQQWVVKLSAELGGTPPTRPAAVVRSPASIANTSSGPSLSGAPLLSAPQSEPAGDATMTIRSNEDGTMTIRGNDEAQDNQSSGPSLRAAPEQLPPGTATPARVNPQGTGDGPRFQETRRPLDDDTAVCRLPPTPDNVPGYWAGRDSGGSIQSLPPVNDDPPSYPPSRY